MSLIFRNNWNYSLGCEVISFLSSSDDLFSMKKEDIHDKKASDLINFLSPFYPDSIVTYLSWKLTAFCQISSIKPIMNFSNLTLNGYQSHLSWNSVLMNVYLFFSHDWANFSLYLETHKFISCPTYFLQDWNVSPFF